MFFLSEHSLKVDSIRWQGFLQSHMLMKKESLCILGQDLYLETTSVNWKFCFLFIEELFKIQSLFV